MSRKWVPVSHINLFENEEEDYDTGRVKRYRSDLHRFAKYLVDSSAFNSFIMVVIVANSVTIAVETDITLKRENVWFFSGADFAYLAIYTLEFFIKLYAEPRGYWANNFNRFDFAILLFSYLQFLEALSLFGQIGFLRVLRALRALRALRGVSFVRGLQVILVALIRTIASIVNLVALLLLLMYVFAIMGFYFFAEGNPEEWGSLGRAFFSLFTFVTADGWTAIQAGLDRITVSSRIYSVVFLAIGHFIFSNLFIGVVIQNLEEATDEDKRQQLKKRQAHIEKKKERVLQMQRGDLERLLRRQNEDPGHSMQHVLAGLAGKLRHEDLVPMTHLSSHLTWLESYLVSLHHQDATAYRSQQVHFEIANTLADLLEQRLRNEEENMQ